ncbi:SAM-dependent methyltransferase [Nocardiopsis sp. LOL_012]|uniref:SAM-dependent methyltransferase n=1 Tax=Nocardiopsis sp. LOL_012 TaxID=3345409 RepID=UPI003A8C8284
MTEVRRPEESPFPRALWRRGSARLSRRRRDVVSLARQAPPGADEDVRLHRRFLDRVIDYLAVDAGVRQFVDWGCPAPGTAARVRQRDPEAAVVRVAPAGVAGVVAEPGVPALSRADAAPAALLDRMSASGLVDFGEPLAVLMTRPFTAQAPPAWIGDLHTRMSGGGYLALAGTAPHAAVEAAFSPFVPLEPGVADIGWWPYPDEDVSLPGTGTLGGLARAPGTVNTRQGRPRRWR